MTSKTCGMTGSDGMGEIIVYANLTLAIIGIVAIIIQYIVEGRK